MTLFQDVTTDKRDKLVLLRLTKNEKALLKAVAKRRGKRMQTLIRDALGVALGQFDASDPR